MAGDVTQNGLNDDHALGPAKAAKGRVALRVELAAVGRDGHIFKKVRVVGMKDRAVCHRAGQVGAEAAVRSHHQLQAVQATSVVKACGVLIGKRVAFTGNHEVVVAVQAQFDGAFQFMSCHGRPHRQVPGLRLLTTKCAAHAPTFHTHCVVVQPQRVCHPVLHFAGVLRAGVNNPLVLFLRQHIGNLAFQVKVLLAAHLQRAA